MLEFFQAALNFPTVIFTGLLGLVMLFWLLVLMAGVDTDSLDFHADGTDLHVDMDGAELDLAGPDAAPDMAADGDVDGASGAHLAGGTKGMGGAVFDFLNVGKVPISIVGSVGILAAWFGSMLLELYGRPALGAFGAGLISGMACLALAGMGGLTLGALATRPLRGVFKHQTIHGQHALIGQVCTILTAKVTGTFGQAELKTNAAPLVLPVRCAHENRLVKGQHAVIAGYDPKTQTYLVGELAPEHEALARAAEGEIETDWTKEAPPPAQHLGERS